MNNLLRILHDIKHPERGVVWQLHRVTNEDSKEEKMREYEIKPAQLISLIESSLRKGYHFISIDQLYHMIISNHYDKKFIVVTLDDGYADNYEMAFPIFKQYNVPFCIFITKDNVEKGKEPYRFLTEEQICKLDKECLCTIASHTVSHPRLYVLAEDQRKEEIKICKDWLEQLLHHPVNYFAYPYGAYDDTTIEKVKESGISMAFSAWGGAIRKRKPIDIYQVPRLLITPSTVK